MCVCSRNYMQYSTCLMWNCYLQLFMLTCHKTFILIFLLIKFLGWHPFFISSKAMPSVDGRHPFYRLIMLKTFKMYDIMSGPFRFGMLFLHNQKFVFFYIKVSTIIVLFVSHTLNCGIPGSNFCKTVKSHWYYVYFTWVQNL